MSILLSYIKKRCHKIFDIINPIQIHGSSNYQNIKSKLGSKFFIRVSGDKNIIQIGEKCVLTNTEVCIQGDNNKLIIENQVRFMGPCRIIMGGNSTLHIKWNAGIRGVEFNLNGADIEVGELCMFSYGITLRNHDSHKIIDPQTGQVLNPPKNIILGNHVWIAQNATILKGCEIAENSVIGFGSVVTKSCEAGSILTGVPARVVKRDISWDY